MVLLIFWHARLCLAGLRMPRLCSHTCAHTCMHVCINISNISSKCVCACVFCEIERERERESVQQHARWKANLNHYHVQQHARWKAAKQKKDPAKTKFSYAELKAREAEVESQVYFFKMFFIWFLFLVTPRNAAERRSVCELRCLSEIIYIYIIYVCVSCIYISYIYIIYI